MVTMSANTLRLSPTFEQRNCAAAERRFESIPLLILACHISRSRNFTKKSARLPELLYAGCAERCAVNIPNQENDATD